MTSSACEVLMYESDRYLNYIIADTNLRRKIVDEQSFIEVARKVFKSDTSLSNLISCIESSGESLSSCLGNIYQSSEIQQLIKENVRLKRNEIRTKLKREKPKLRGRALRKEVDRRLTISKGITASKVEKTKPIQITIQQAFKPVKVQSYVRKGTKVKAHRRTKTKRLTGIERDLIVNNLHKKTKDIIQLYYQQGLDFRTPISLKLHIVRLRRKLKKKR